MNLTYLCISIVTILKDISFVLFFDEKNILLDKSFDNDPIPVF
jgi:hypothetical protein